MKYLRGIVVSVIFIVSVLAAGAKGGGEKNTGGKASEAAVFFEDINVLPNTSIKDQAISGTCWAFATLSLFESELLRLGKTETDLSEMFIVRYAYYEKAQKKVRLQGNLNFSAGGIFHDVTNMIRKYGIVPEKVFDGLSKGTSMHKHTKMDNELKAFVDSVIENKKSGQPLSWEEGFESILNNYLGKVPSAFRYKGKKYTPQSFASKYIGLNIDDYVEISSYTHHPFYEPFILEVPDNWSWGQVYNVPIAEMQEIIDYSLQKGYTVAWASDITEEGFSTRKYGVAIVDDEALGSEFSCLEEEKVKSPEGFTEAEISQEMRQEAFDNYQTTDDHAMHIVGLASDQNGNEFYKIKNSWGLYNKLDGFFYASKSYVNYKTTCLMVHKAGIPKHIREKLNL